MAGQVLAVIGGSGIGESFAQRDGCERVEVDTPFGPPSGPVMRVTIDGLACLFLSRHGEGHVLSPSCIPYRANIFALKKLGAMQVIATGATGSLRDSIAPGDLVICDQVIDRTRFRAGTFFDEGLVSHVELADPFCSRLRGELIHASTTVDARLHEDGTYICMEGPALSTRAESLMHREMGGDLIGMTCMPEAKLAREAELCYALVAFATDYDAWRPHDPDVEATELLAEIISNMRRASAAAISLIDATIKHLASQGSASCKCHDALELAIWSDKSTVDRATVERLEPLVGRYFGNP